MDQKDLTGLFDLNEKLDAQEPGLPEPDAPPALDEPPAPSAEDLSFEPIAPDLSLPDPSHEIQAQTPDAELPPDSPVLDDPFATTPDASSTIEEPAASASILDENPVSQEFAAIADPLLSQHTTPPRPSPEWVPAAYPFHLKIFGYLTALQREELGDLIASFQLGLKPEDLELQFESGRIFLPQISEYVGVAVIQKIRSWSVEIQFAPADQEHPTSAAASSPEIQDIRVTAPTPALPTTTQAVPRESKKVRAVGLLHSTCVVTMETYLKNQSPEYLRAIDFLRRELSRQAIQLHAQEIWEFKIETESLPLYSGIRLTATAQAVKTGTSIGGDSVPQSV